MSHIPSAAMPHAKAHDPAPEPTVAPPIKREQLPWAALAAGGVLAIGGAVTAAWLLRGRGGEAATRQTGRGHGAAKRVQSKSEGTKTPRGATGKRGPRKTKAEAGEG